MTSNYAMTEILPSSPQPTALPSQKVKAIPLPDTTLPSHGSSESPRLGTTFSGTGPMVPARERWNNPRMNTWRLAAIFFAFIVFGMNDASYGALIPYVCHWLSRLVFNPHVASLLTSVASPDRSRLPPILSRHLPRLPLSILRLHSCRLFQRSSTPVFRQTWYCLYWPLLQDCRLRSHLCTSPIPGCGCDSCIGWARQWIVGRSMERLDWDNGSAK